MATSLLDSLGQTNLSFGGQTPPVTNPNPIGVNGQTALAGSGLDFDGATPPVTNPNPLGVNGINSLAGSILDRNNGATPPSYSDSLPG